MDAPRGSVHLRRMRSRPAHSLLELAFALAIMAALAGAAARPLQSARHELAVAAARRELAAGVAMTRSVAVLAGGARFIIDTGSGTAWIETGSGVHAGSLHEVGARHGVTLAAARPRVELRFDALGVGRLANATIGIRRGSAEAQLVVSAYGRVRP